MLDEAGYAYPVFGLGPGSRVALWVRGCHRRCPGCIAPELWHSGTMPRPTSAIAQELLPLLTIHDGLTISGGEPFEQAAALHELISLLREHITLEVLIYSGYLREELAIGDAATQMLLHATDILIDGEFLLEASNELLWRGSDNQRVHLISSSAQEKYAGMVNEVMPAQRHMQLQQLADGQIRIIGIPKRGDIAAQRKALRARGLLLKEEDE